MTLLSCVALHLSRTPSAALAFTIWRFSLALVLWILGHSRPSLSSRTANLPPLSRLHCTLILFTSGPLRSVLLSSGGGGEVKREPHRTAAVSIPGQLQFIGCVRYFLIFVFFRFWATWRWKAHQMINLLSLLFFRYSSFTTTFPVPNVAVGFLSDFYRGFVARDEMVARLSDMYGSTSRSAIVGHPVLDGTSTGKEIMMHLAKIDRVLNDRKVEISSVDPAPLPDGSIQLLCRGTLFLRGSKWKIIHVFVLSPTQHRHATYYISSEHLCFLSVMDEKPPHGVKVLEPSQVATFLAEETQRRHQEALDRQKREEAAALELAHRAEMQQQEQQQATRNEERRQHQHENANNSNAQTPSKPLENEKRERRERREPRKPRDSRENRKDAPRPAADAAAPPSEASEPQAPRKNRRERKPRQEDRKDAAAAEQPAAAPAGEPKPREERPKREREQKPRGGKTVEKEGGKAPRVVRSGPTNAIRITSVPTTVSMESVTEALKKKGANPVEVFRFGRDHVNVVAKYASESDAEKVYKPASVDIDGAVYKVMAFYPIYIYIYFCLKSELVGTRKLRSPSSARHHNTSHQEEEYNQPRSFCYRCRRSLEREGSADGHDHAPRTVMTMPRGRWSAHPPKVLNVSPYYLHMFCFFTPSHPHFFNLFLLYEKYMSLLSFGLSKTAVRKDNAKKLAAGYTKKKRFFECCYLSAFTLLWCSNLISVGRYFVRADDVNLMQLVWMPVFIVVAMTLADLVSGLAHWGLDSWGSPATPVFGPFIRSFREHHVDQVAMCKHDFIETNADTTLPLLPFVFLQFVFIRFRSNARINYPENLNNDNVGFHVFFLTFAMLVTLTNEIHKWSHQPKQAVIVRKLMDMHILLSPVAHRKHHKDPFDKSYCITTGWLNPLLDAIRFWRILEAIVTSATGAIPRENDQTLLGKKQ
eukprot:gene4028-2882_t